MLLLKKLARGRMLALFGPAASDSTDETRKKLKYFANETVSIDSLWKDSSMADANDGTETGKCDGDIEVKKVDEDSMSVKSSDSNEDESDEFSLVIESSMSTETGLRWICVDPVHIDEWSYDMERVGAESTLS